MTVDRSQVAKTAWHTRRINELKAIQNHMPPRFLDEMFGTNDVYEIVRKYEGAGVEKKRRRSR